MRIKENNRKKLSVVLVYVTNENKERMRRFVSLLFVFLSIGFVSAQENASIVIHGYGDLSILHNTDNSVRIVSAKADGDVLDTTFVRLPEDLRFRYFAMGDDTDLNFEFKLHKRIKHADRKSVV